MTKSLLMKPFTLVLSTPSIRLADGDSDLAIKVCLTYDEAIHLSLICSSSRRLADGDSDFDVGLALTRTLTRSGTDVGDFPITI